MRLINKKYLILLTSILLVLTTILALKQTKNNELSEVKLLESSNNNSFAMYRETNNGYEEYDSDKFPEGYVLNINESKCLDNKGNEQKGILSYENGLVTVTSGNTSYCYLYFDESLGLEIKNKNPNRLSTEVKGDMYRFQGNQTDNVENYICFGTSDKQTCIEHPDQYMYRIIGIEAKTGRVKVIKKEALDDGCQWYSDSDTDIDFSNSIIVSEINGDKFLFNDEFIPDKWEEKISVNSWTYGDMLSNDPMGARQIGKELYLSETGQKETIWDAKANKGDEGAQSAYIDSVYSPYQGETIYYIRHTNEKWSKSFKSKVSLMYLHDYYLSVSDEANCQFDEKNYDGCKLGWLHLLNNDMDAPNEGEWTMNRLGWTIWAGFFIGAYIYSTGGTSTGGLNNPLSVRPVFYIDASQTLKDGTGKLNDPFIINI